MAFAISQMDCRAYLAVVTMDDVLMMEVVSFDLMLKSFVAEAVVVFVAVAVVVGVVEFACEVLVVVVAAVAVVAAAAAVVAVVAVVAAAAVVVVDAVIQLAVPLMVMIFVVEQIIDLFDLNSKNLLLRNMLNYHLNFLSCLHY